jgi:DNA repair protein RadA/Sms
MAILSSFTCREVDPDTVILGEVGLGGEVRSVVKAESRVKEAAHLGFKRCLLPKKNWSGLSTESKGKIEVHPISTLEEAICVLWS